MLLLFSDQIEAQAGNMPAVTVLFETSPGVWANISDDLVGGDIVRGKQRELDRYQTGSATLVLRNDDRRYDPNHAASPYNGSIKPRRRMRIQATWTGTTYDEFVGKVDRWIPDYRGPHTADVGVQLSDAFKDLARAQLASSAYVQEVLADGPTHWWRLDEAGGGSTVFDEVADTDGTVAGATTLGDATLISRDPGAAATFGTDGDYISFDPGGFPSGSGAFTVEFVIQTSTGPSTRSRVIGEANGIAFEIGLAATVFGATPIYMWIGATTATMNVGAGPATHNVGDGDPHHIAITRAADGTIKIWFDGEDRTNGSPTTTEAISPTTIWMGVRRLSIEDGWAGTLDEVAVYDYALAADRIGAHAAQVSTPWDGDTVGERIGRVLDAVAWPAELRDLDTGTTTLQPATLAQSALEHAQTAAASDFGLLYVTKDGRVRFEDRSNLVNQTSVATFTDEHGSDPAIITLTPEFGDDLIRNDVTISRLDGKAQNVRDDDSITEYGRISYTLDGLYHDSDTLSLGAAEFIVSEYAEPRQRISGLTIYPKKTPASLWPAVLGLELADKVTVAHTPQGVGAEIEQASAVEGISHRFGPDQWETSLNISPAFGSGDGDDCVLELDTGPCGLDDARLWF